LERVICRFGHKVGPQYNLSSVDRWIDREGQHDIGRHVEDVCDASVAEVRGIYSLG